MIRDDKFHLLLEKYNHASLAIYQKINVPWHLTDRERSEDSLHFSVGGYFNIISSWLVEKEPRPANEIAYHIQPLFYTVANRFMMSKKPR